MEEMWLFTRVMKQGISTPSDQNWKRNFSKKYKLEEGCLHEGKDGAAAIDSFEDIFLKMSKLKLRVFSSKFSLCGLLIKKANLVPRAISTSWERGCKNATRLLMEATFVSIYKTYSSQNHIALKNLVTFIPSLPRHCNNNIFFSSEETRSLVPRARSITSSTFANIAFSTILILWDHWEPSGWNTLLA